MLADRRRRGRSGRVSLGFGGKIWSAGFCVAAGAHLQRYELAVTTCLAQRCFALPSEKGGISASSFLESLAAGGPVLQATEMGSVDPLDRWALRAAGWNPISPWPQHAACPAGSACSSPAMLRSLRPVGAVAADKFAPLLPASSMISSRRPRGARGLRQLPFMKL